ncbi:MAG TPA: proline dehydrogenase family protein [Candidatus Kapabacteria bacterium]|nr:proline dehydrogenase family protein [Candidatus Kapabacteria bacterium]
MLNQLIINTLPIMPKSFVYLIAKKYIAGANISDAVKVSKELMSKNGWSTIDALGEFVTSKEAALKEVKIINNVLDAINSNKLQTYLSVKPTSLGMGIDYQFGYENILQLLDKAKKLGITVRLDMENSPYTDNTLKMYKNFRDAGYDNIGIVIQAYMRRSINDITKLLDYKPNIRLCKGIYNEDISIAYKGFEEIRDNYKSLFRLILDNDCYIGIATHDEDLIQFGLQEIKDRNLSKQQYEFQMLLGVREQKRDEILAQGHHLRVYVPFGEDWYGYSTRRLKENPQMAGHIFKAIFGIGQ